MHQLYVSAQLEGVTGLAPTDTEDAPFEYCFKVQCTSCREDHDKPVYMNRFEKHDIPNSRGEASFVFKCSFCSKHSNAEISLPKNYAKYDGEGWKPLLSIESRGIDLEFVPEGPFECTGAESGTAFEEVDLEEGEWYDYDEKEEAEVSITDVQWKIE